MWRIVLSGVVALHLFVVFGNVVAFFILPFSEPWYLSLPLCSFIVWVSCHKNGRCPMTVLENKVRLKLGMPEITGFVKHYVIRHFRRKA